MEVVESNFVGHEPCEACGSSDANSRYDDGHLFCMSCHAYTAPENALEPVKQSSGTTKHRDLLHGSYVSLKARNIDKKSCQKYDYSVGKDAHGKTVQIATYRNSKGEKVAQKLRDANKNFSIVGDAKKMSLYGSHLWSKGKTLVICEGEIDTISASIAQGYHKFPTVGIPNGASSAKKSLLDNWDYLKNFEQLILMFDNDTAGRESMQACGAALPIGKIKIAGTFDYKDCNEALQNNDGAAIVNSVFTAQPYRPDNIVTSADFRDVISESDAKSSVQYPFKLLNKITGGIFPSTMVLLAAGSGLGKSTLIREIAYSLHKEQGQKVGLLMLEETNKRTLQSLVGTHINKNITVDENAATKEEIEAGFDSLFKNQDVVLLDHFGSTELENILEKIQYMVLAHGCTHIFLDHVSILVSGLGAESNERQLIDYITTTLRTKIVQELNVTLFLVSHLSRPKNGGSHEAGTSDVQLSQLRGSHSLAQLSDVCISLSVDRDDPSSNRRTLMCLKNRHLGTTGFGGTVQYNLETSRLTDCELETTF